MWWNTLLLAVQAQTQPADNGRVSAQGMADVAEVATDEVLPLVQFEGAPLVDVIKTLARQAGLNVIFDPQVLATAEMPALGRPDRIRSCIVSAR